MPRILQIYLMLAGVIMWFISKYFLDESIWINLWNFLDHQWWKSFAQFWKYFLSKCEINLLRKEVKDKK